MTITFTAAGAEAEETEAVSHSQEALMGEELMGEDAGDGEGYSEGEASEVYDVHYPIEVAARPSHPLPLNPSQEAADGSQQAFAGRTAIGSALRGGGRLGYSCLANPSSASDPRRPPNPGLARMVGQYPGLSTVDPTDRGTGYRYSPNPTTAPFVRTAEETVNPGHVPYHMPAWANGVRGDGPSALSQGMGSPSDNARGEPAPHRR